MNLLSTEVKNDVLTSVKSYLSEYRTQILDANKEDIAVWQGADQALYDRLVVNDKKVDSMISAVDQIIKDSDPVARELYSFYHDNGMKVINKTAPFGTILIIYESRPDVTIEAAMVAFKSNNKILLKGGKEAICTNRILVSCWHKALSDNGLSKDWVTLLELDRNQTQEFLRNPGVSLDLIVPRGGEGLISFVKEHAKCPVLISGRGNNFLYVHEDANWALTIPVIVNAKTDKISACNSLDKVLINKNLPDLSARLKELLEVLNHANVEVLIDQTIEDLNIESKASLTDISKEWGKEYLAMKISIGLISNMTDAIELINEHSGGHSSTIMTQNECFAEEFMNEVDVAAVYHNASTRFTDGGQFGLGAELAISTDKLHHRGPLGLHQLVTNKWYVFGTGQIRN